MKYICNICRIECTLKYKNDKIKMKPESCPFEEKQDCSNWHFIDEETKSQLED